MSISDNLSTSDLELCVGGGQTTVFNADAQEATVIPYGPAEGRQPIKVPPSGSADIQNGAFQLAFGGKPSNQLGQATFSALGQPMRFNQHQVDYLPTRK